MLVKELVDRADAAIWRILPMNVRINMRIPPIWRGIEFEHMDVIVRAEVLCRVTVHAQDDTVCDLVPKFVRGSVT